MDVDLEAVEVVFAQKLASGEPTTRKRALRSLQEWIREQSRTSEFGSENMRRLCKGIHYVMWMQDKMLLQEELADSIASLTKLFHREEQSVLFVKTMLTSLSDEWSRIDRWRMDKFLMLVRRLLRGLFAHLRASNWQTNLVQMYIDAFKECAISAEKSFCEGLKFHFASIYLDELDNAGGIERDRVIEFILQLIANKSISNYLFDSVVEEIFVSILHLYADEKASGEEDEGEAMDQDDDQKLNFNYGEISRKLFEVGKNPEMRSDRRKRLYAIAQKFKAAEAGEDPFETVTKTKSKPALPKNVITDAVSRLLNEHSKDVAARLKAKKRKKAAKREMAICAVSENVQTKSVIKKKKSKAKKSLSKVAGMGKKRGSNRASQMNKSKRSKKN